VVKKRSSSGAPMTPCATHGLLYNPKRHAGCVLCRRLEKRSRRWSALRVSSWIAATIAIATAVYFARAGLQRSPALRVEVAADAAQRRCAEPLAVEFADCARRCEPARDAGTAPCGAQCLAALESALRTRCAATLEPPEGTAQTLLVSGAAPPREDIALALKHTLTALAQCDAGPALMRIAVEGATGRVSAVSASTPAPGSADCARKRLRSYFFPPAIGDYVVVAKAHSVPRPRPALPPKPDPRQLEREAAEAQIRALERQGEQARLAEPQPAAPPTSKR
jgi:hypothetical protein